MSPKESPQSARPRLQLSATQLAASVLAAVTATIAGSYLGVNGTVIGAGVASLLTVVGNSVYGHYIHRTGQRVRTVATVGPVARRLAPAPTIGPAPTRPLPRVDDVSPVVATDAWPVTATDAAPVPQRAQQRTRVIIAWRRVGLTAVGVFAALLTLLTTLELATGRPISDLLRGKAGSGTTVFGSSQGGTAVLRPAPRVTVTQTVVPAVVTQTPTVTETAPAVTVTPSPTPTPTPTGSPGQSSPNPSSPAPTTP